MAKVRNICSFAKSFHEKFLMPMDVRIEKSWKDRLQNEFDKPYFEQLTDFVRREYRTSTVYPPGNQMFRAFDICPFDKVKVVILGQDPYHEPRQAHGLTMVFLFRLLFSIFLKRLSLILVFLCPKAEI